MNKVVKKANKINQEISQSNDYIESIYLQEFSKLEQQLIEYLITTMTKNDLLLYEQQKEKVVQFHALEFARLLKLEDPKKPGNFIYRDAYKICKSIAEKKINFKFKNNNETSWFIGNIISTAEYNAGTLEITIPFKIIPYFVHLKSEFTKFKLKYIFAIDSGYGIRLYKLLKQYEKIKERSFSVHELRQLFGLNDDKYKLYTDFRRNCIDKPISMINENTDVKIEYVEKKIGRKIEKIEFKINSKLTHYQQALILFPTWLTEQKDKALKSQSSGIVTIKQNQIINQHHDFHKVISKSSNNSIEITSKLIQKNQILKELFDDFTVNHISNYEADSVELLQYFGRDTLFGN